ncbi:glycoside hydrolase [Sphingomonas sp. I4]
MWDWNQDANQRWWLDAITARVKQPIFEAFSNSPPWFMTVSGRVSGAEKGTDDNLRPGQETAFATYLARVTDELQRRHHLTFRTLSPVNEPNTNYWFAANTQEGAHWSPARQAQMIDATAAALKIRGWRRSSPRPTKPPRTCSSRTGPPTRPPRAPGSANSTSTAMAPCNRRRCATLPARRASRCG